MKNPFLRLKHYRSMSDDPKIRAIEQQENHATECLAACLVFSSNIRNEFIRFLLNDAAKGVHPGEVDVLTQEPIKGGYIDLVLRQPKNFVIAVEVKVKSREDGDQLLKYRKWLDRQTEEPFLFTLVRNEDTAFHPAEYGASHPRPRRTWWALHKTFKQILGANNLPDVESSLINNFCDYLEKEGIVSTYETKDLLSYAAGVKARNAVNGIFTQIGSRLQPEGFETSLTEGRSGQWPQLRIQHPRWNKIFGNGNNEKISLWFCVRGIWEAKEDSFGPDIELWHRDHGNDWRLGEPKLSNWLATLRARKFKWDVYERGFNKSRENLEASEIGSEPTRIVAYRHADAIALNPSQLPSEDDLINTLVTAITDYAKVVDALGA
jgi:PD-(D/E)XK nuclease superfamily